MINFWKDLQAKGRDEHDRLQTLEDNFLKHVGVMVKSCKGIQTNYNLVEIWQVIRMVRIM